jgi:hypothetical protein
MKESKEPFFFSLATASLSFLVLFGFTAASFFLAVDFMFSLSSSWSNSSFNTSSPSASEHLIWEQLIFGNKFKLNSVLLGKITYGQRALSIRLFSEYFSGYFFFLFQAWNVNYSNPCRCRTYNVINK